MRPLLFASLASLIILGLMLMTGRALSLRSPILLDRLKQPKVYWWQVSVAGACAIMFLVLAVLTWPGL